MKKIITVFAALVIALCAALPVYAEGGKVTYDESSKKVIFQPGSEYSPTDLFPNFKDVMPGDTLTQQITVKNDEKNKVKVKIYLRSLGAHEDSVEFLSKLGLKVQSSEDNEMAYMFDAAADETATLTDWVCLGTLYSGGEVNLDVTLSVPTELDNMFQKHVGYLDWEFKIEELPVEPEDPKPPQTGDDTNLTFWIVAFTVSASTLIILFVWRKKNDDENKKTEIN